MSDKSSKKRGVRERLKAFDDFLGWLLCYPFAFMAHLVQRPFGRTYVFSFLCALAGLLVVGFRYFFVLGEFGLYLFLYCAFVICAGIGLVWWASVERLEKFEWVDLDLTHKVGRIILVVVCTAIFLAPFAYVAWKLAAS